MYWFGGEVAGVQLSTPPHVDPVVADVKFFGRERGFVIFFGAQEAGMIILWVKDSALVFADG